MNTKLGQLLIEGSLITVEQLNNALEEQAKNGGRLGTTLINMGVINEEQLINFLSKQYDAPAINLH